MPVDLDPEWEARGRALIDRCLVLLGDALHSKLHPHLGRSIGPDWWRRVKARNGPFRRRDLVSYGQCILGDGALFATTKPFRDALGLKLSPDVARVIQDALRVRNRFAHPDQPLTAEAFRQDTGQLLLFGKVLGLDCYEDLRRIAQLDPLSRDGVGMSSPDAADIAALREELEALRAKQSGSEAVLANAYAESERAHDALMAAVRERDRAVAEREQSDQTARELGEMLAETVDRAAASQALLTEVRASEALALERAAVVERLEREVETFRAALQRYERRVTEVEDEASAAASDTHALSSRLAGELEFASVSDAEDGDDPDAGVVEVGYQWADGEIPVPPLPGEEWRHGRGEQVWTLSRAGRSLTRNEDGLTLVDIFDEAIAARLVDDFLRVRPTGGRVWVDTWGFATTYIDGALTYLGELTDIFDEDHVDPPLGTPCETGGLRYSVTLTDVVRRRDGSSLKQALPGVDITALLDRLLNLKPHGGRYKVNAEGMATTHMDGTWVFAGRVRAEEWFPGDIGRD